MRTLKPSLLPVRSTRSLLFVLATLGAASSLLACTGDDTNPPAPDAGPGASDATTATDGAGGDSGKESDSSAKDAATGVDSATGTDAASATDAAAQPG